MSNKYQGISEPRPELLAIVEVLGQLKQNVELLTGQRGPEQEYSVDARFTALQQQIEALTRRVQALE